MPEEQQRAVSAPTFTVSDGLQWASTRGLARYAHQLRRHLQTAVWQPLHLRHPQWTSGSGRILIFELIQPLEQLRLRPQIAFYPHNALPALLPGRALRVLVLHDLLFLEDQHRASAGNRYRRMKLDHSLRHAHVILTVSEASRAEIRNYLDRDLEILVLPNCLAPAFEALPSLSVLSPAPVPTILHFGGHAPSKNTRALIEAVAQLTRSGTPVRLEIAAMAGQQPLVEHWRDAAGLSSAALHVLPRLTDAELLDAYRRAQIHAMPSTGEGFGIPVIEAARAGALNMLTPLAVFRELMGDAAIYSTGFDAASIAAALRSALAFSATQSPAAQDPSEQGAALRAAAFARSDSYLFSAIHHRYALPALAHIAAQADARSSGAESLR